MKDWKQIAQRFRLLKFKDLTKEETYSYFGLFSFLEGIKVRFVKEGEEKNENI